MNIIDAVNVDWRTAKSCAGGNCVQVAPIGDSVAMRDSKRPEGEILLYSVDEWRDFVAGVRGGDFDDLLL